MILKPLNLFLPLLLLSFFKFLFLFFTIAFLGHTIAPSLQVFVCLSCVFCCEMLLLLGLSMCFCVPCSLCCVLACFVLFYCSCFFLQLCLGRYYFIIFYLLFFIRFGGPLIGFLCCHVFTLQLLISKFFFIVFVFYCIGVCVLFSGGSCIYYIIFSLQTMASVFFFFFWLTDFYRICIAWCSSVRAGAWWRDFVIFFPSTRPKYRKI